MQAQTISALLKENQGVLYNSAVCAVNKAGQEAYFEAVGCVEDAVFDYASISKIFTTSMLLMQVGAGRVALEDNLASVFAEKNPGAKTYEKFKNITIQQLLSHSAGLPAWHPFYATGKGFYAELEDVLAGGKPVNRVEYSDINFMLLGEALCMLTEKSLQENLQELNENLGTSFTYNPANKSACVPTEFGNKIEKKMCEERGFGFAGWRNESMQIQGDVNDGNSFYFWQGQAGHAGVFGTAQDLLCLAQLYLNCGKMDEKQLIPAKLVQQSYINYGAGRGLGWDLGQIFPHGAGHTGFTGTAMWLCPEKQTAAVLLASRLPIAGPPNMQSMRKAVFENAYLF